MSVTTNVAARARAADLAEVREFVDTEVVPRAGDFDRAGRLPGALLGRVAELGLWAPFLPAATGGAGMDMVTLGRIHEEVGRGCSSLRSLLTVHGMVSWSVSRWGSDEQRDRWLGELAGGRTLGCFCLSEPGSGCDASAVGTKASPAGTGSILNGRKKWITGGLIADLLLVFARAGDGMSAFLVPRTIPGVEVSPIEGILGTRASMLAEVILRDVRVGPDAVLGPPGWAAGTVMTGALDLGRYSVACGSVGIIHACLQACAAYTSRRRVRDGLLRDLQLIRRKMSDLVTSHRAARLLCEHAGRLKDADDPATIMATWVAKYYASTAAATAASEAVQVHGANGCSTDYPVERLYRDAKIMEIIEGSSELQQTTIAEDAYREVPR